MNDRSTRLINLGTTILYYSTTTEDAMLLLQRQQCKTYEKGIVGYGIYFTGIPQDIVDRVILEVEVYLGNMYIIPNLSTFLLDEKRKFKNVNGLHFEDVIKQNIDSIYIQKIDTLFLGLFNHNYIIYNSDQIKNIYKFAI
jgi:hypothetical protein